MELNYVILVYKDNQFLSKFPLKETVTLGTDPRCDYVVTDTSFLKEQFLFYKNDQEIVLKNLETRFNPNLAPRLNQNLMSNQASYVLNVKDQIILGNIRIVLSDAESAFKLTANDLKLSTPKKIAHLSYWQKIKKIFKQSRSPIWPTKEKY